ncbi:MAG: hypothetical protein E7028_04190 [Planctomycetaceae bacterium]|nr:hypothetical protein [Planctomycetaceae bacterium]
MFWICRKCYSLYDTEIQKCSHCGGMEFIQKTPENQAKVSSPASFTDSASPSSFTKSKIGQPNQDLKELRRAELFIQKMQKEEFERRNREYSTIYPRLLAQFQEEMRIFQIKNNELKKFKIRYLILFWSFFLMLFISLTVLAAFLGVCPEEFMGFMIIFAVPLFFVMLFFLHRTKTFKESKKVIPIPQAPPQTPPFPDTDDDFERYFEYCPNPPTGKEYFRPRILKRLISILENRFAETIPEAMRFMVDQDRAKREHLEEMEHLRNLRSDAARAARAAENASTMATINTAITLLNSNKKN